MKKNMHKHLSLHELRYSYQLYIFCLTHYDVITTYCNVQRNVLSAIFDEELHQGKGGSHQNLSLEPLDMIGHIKTLGLKCIMSALTPPCGGLEQ